MIVTSNKETIHVGAERLYLALTNFFAGAGGVTPPEPISNWQATPEGCSFTINNMINCTMQLAEKVPYQKVSYNISTNNGMTAVATFNIEDLVDNSNLQIEANADVPVFLQAMIKLPLQNALNKAIGRIKDMAERSNYGV